MTVTGNDAVVAATALALWQFSNSCGVMKVKEIFGEAIRIQVSVTPLSWSLGICWLELETNLIASSSRRWIGYNYNSKQIGFYFRVCDRPYRVIIL